MKPIIALLAAAVITGIAVAPHAAAQGSPSTLSMTAVAPPVAVTPGSSIEIPFAITKHIPAANVCLEPRPLHVAVGAPDGTAHATPSSFEVEPWVSPTGEIRNFEGVLTVKPPADHPAFHPFLVRMSAVDLGCQAPASTDYPSRAEQTVAVQVGYSGTLEYASRLDEAALGNGTIFRWTIEARHVGNGPAAVDIDIVESETSAGIITAGGRLVLDASQPGGEPVTRSTVIELRPRADAATQAVVDLAGTYAGPMPYEPDVGRLTVELPAAQPPDPAAAQPAQAPEPSPHAQVPGPGLVLALLGAALGLAARRRP